MHPSFFDFEERQQLEQDLKKGYTQRLVYTEGLQKLKDASDKLGYRIEIVADSVEECITDNGKESKVDEGMTLVHIFFGNNTSLDALWKAVIE